jgi:hypothetical protein
MKADRAMKARMRNRKADAQYAEYAAVMAEKRRREQRGEQ